jgi:protease II
MNHPYICINLLKVSSDNRMLAFTMDTTGDDSFSVHVKDLKTGARLKVQFTNLQINVSIYLSIEFTLGLCKLPSSSSQSPDGI